MELEDIEGYSSKLLVKERKGNQVIGSAKHRFQKGDLLVSKLRMYLKKVLVADEDGYCSSEIMPTSFMPFCQNDFAKLFYVSPYLLTRVDQLQYGCKMPRLGTKDGRKLLFPLPPEKEQRRIVRKAAAIDSLLIKIETLDNQIQSLSLLLKKKVLSIVFSSDKSYYTRQLSEVAQITMGQSVPSEKMHSHKNANDMEFHQGKTF
ncbi:MAG: restriction endonuclease subunit S, partial [Bacilli bacterium]|nr:restriction endonuclease subunit S [Bacilli bacterium]